MSKISIKGIILGCLVMLAIDIILGIVMFLIFKGDIAEEAMKATEDQTFILILSVIIGTLSTVIGGYTAARIAPKAPYINSGIIGVLGIIMTILFSGRFPLWFNILSYVSILPAALVGGYVACTGKTEMCKNNSLADKKTHRSD